MTVQTLLGAVAPVGVPIGTPRIGTRSAYDFAYWAGTSAEPGLPENYEEPGAETDGASLVSWAAAQVGVDASADYSILLPVLRQSPISIDDALKTRGAVLYCPKRVSVCMGFSDVVDVVNGNFWMYRVDFRPTSPNLCKNNWEAGALLPGLIY